MNVRLLRLAGCGQACPVTPDMLKLVRGEFGWSEDGMAKMDVIQNEKLIEFFSKKWVLVMYYIEFQIIH